MSNQERTKHGPRRTNPQKWAFPESTTFARSHGSTYRVRATVRPTMRSPPYTDGSGSAGGPTACGTGRSRATSTVVPQIDDDHVSIGMIDEVLRLEDERESNAISRSNSEQRTHKDRVQSLRNGILGNDASTKSAVHSSAYVPGTISDFSAAEKSLSLLWLVTPGSGLAFDLAPQDRPEWARKALDAAQISNSNAQGGSKVPSRLSVNALRALERPRVHGHDPLATTSAAVMNSKGWSDSLHRSPGGSDSPDTLMGAPEGPTGCTDGPARFGPLP